MSLVTLLGALASAASLLPIAAFLLLGAYALAFRTPTERVVSTVVRGATALALLCALFVFGGYIHHAAAVRVHVATWFHVGNYSFDVTLLLDRTSVTLLLLVSAFGWLIARFSTTYLHRETGFTRFFLLLSLFSGAMSLLVTSGSLDVLFLAWEIVGLTSALLIGYFHERAAPVNASLRAFATYRFCDIGMLVGAVLLHQIAHTTEFADAFTRAHLHGSYFEREVLAGCVIFAAMGKSALLPFGSWLPRAMEGPTPSSAIYYGALSVHGGIYLLIRFDALFAHTPIARVAMVVIGAATALSATVVGRAQSDVKTSLAYAIQTQVGLMVIECGFGLPRLALVHLVLHACLRGWQLLRAPSALRETQLARSAGVSVTAQHGWLLRAMPAPLARWWYRFAFERAFVDTLQDRLVLQPLFAFGAWIHSLEHRGAHMIGDEPERRPARPSMLPPPSLSITGIEATKETQGARR